MRKGTRTETVLRTLNCLTEICDDIKRNGKLPHRQNHYTSKHGCGTFQRVFVDEIMERDGVPTVQDAENLLDRRNDRMKKMAAERKRKKAFIGCCQTSEAASTLRQQAEETKISAIEQIIKALTNGININISIKFEI